MREPTGAPSPLLKATDTRSNGAASSASLRALQRLRDEAHRFGLEYHRALRSRARIGSALDAVPGIGPARRAALLKAFGSVAELRGVPPGDIATRARVPLALARRVADHLAGREGAA